MINLSINFLNDSDRCLPAQVRACIDWASTLGRVSTAITATAAAAIAIASFITMPIPTAIAVATILGGAAA